MKNPLIFLTIALCALIFGACSPTRHLPTEPVIEFPRTGELDSFDQVLQLLDSFARYKGHPSGYPATTYSYNYDIESVFLNAVPVPVQKYHEIYHCTGDTLIYISEVQPDNAANWVQSFGLGTYHGHPLLGGLTNLKKHLLTDQVITVRFHHGIQTWMWQTVTFIRVPDGHALPKANQPMVMDIYFHYRPNEDAAPPRP